MSNYNFKPMTFLPLVYFLALSPAQLMTAHVPSVSRSFASVVSEPEVVEEKFPAFKKYSEEINKEELIALKKPNPKMFPRKIEDYRKKLDEMKLLSAAENKSPVEVDLNRKSLNALVSEMIILEADSKQLTDLTTWSEEDEKSGNASLLELKNELEVLLAESLPKEEPAVAEVEASPEVVTEAVAEAAPVAKAEEIVENKSEVKKEEKVEVTKEKTETPACEFEERNKALTKEVDDLWKVVRQMAELTQQNTQLSMTVLSMYQNQAHMQRQQPLYNPYVAQPYQYILPSNPAQMPVQQPSIWSSGSPYQPQYQVPSFYPDQLYIQQPQQPMQYRYPQTYNAPSYQNYDPRYAQPSPITPGSFGNEPFLYNFTEQVPQMYM